MTAVLLTLLKVLAWLLAAVAVLLLVLLLVPVTADVLYEKGRAYAGVRVLGIRISLLPRKQKARAEQKKGKAASGRTARKKKAEPAAQSASAERTSQRASADEVPADTALAAGSALQQIKTYLDPAKRGVRYLLRHMRLHDVTFVFNVRSADAAEVGMRCGIMWTFVGQLMQTLAMLFGERVEYGEVTVMPCFHPTDGARERFGCKITAAPIIIIVAAVIVWRQLKKQRKQAHSVKEQ